MSPSSTPILVSIALTGFAANSLLCRAALGSETIDAFSFTAVRLVSGAVMLAILSRGKGLRSAGTWGGSIALFLYAVCFALAYRTMTAATGALLLFATVQMAMMSFGLWRGERLSSRQKIGFSIALMGLLILTLPGVEAPDPAAAMLMLVAGVAWAAYSLWGRGSQRALIDTAANFFKASIMSLAALGLGWFGGALHMSPLALLWGTLSGALASGLAYAIWYKVLPRLDAWQAGILQLLTPVLAALGGIFILGEDLTTRVLCAASFVLLGLYLSLKQGGQLPSWNQKKSA